jgi:DNA helicase-2/ATP-dependent DNA helicase PcrA
MQNIEELILFIKKFQKQNPTKTLRDFLNEISLYTNVENKTNKENCVSLMTIHFSKGTEYKNVFVIGLNEGIFPSTHANYLEEERRIAYVAMTRAKENLFLTSRKGFNPRTQNNLVRSRFIDEIGANNFKKENLKIKTISQMDIK